MVLSMVELLERVYETNDCSSDPLYEWHMTLSESDCDDFLYLHNLTCNVFGFGECSIDFGECLSTEYWTDVELVGLGNSVNFAWCKESDATCEDGMHNGNEHGVDCGGSCEKLCPSDPNDSNLWMKVSWSWYWPSDCSGSSALTDVRYVSSESCAEFVAKHRLASKDGQNAEMFVWDGRNVENFEFALDKCLTSSYVFETHDLSDANGMYFVCQDNVQVPLRQELLTDPTCDDGIMNGNEEGLDCGGDCEECPGYADLYHRRMQLTKWIFSTSDCSSEPIGVHYLYDASCSSLLETVKSDCEWDSRFSQCNFVYEECISSDYLFGNYAIWECRNETEPLTFVGGICSDFVNGEQCDGVYLPSGECSCEETNNIDNEESKDTNKEESEDTENEESEDTENEKRQNTDNWWIYLIIAVGVLMVVALLLYFGIKKRKDIMVAELVTEGGEGEGTKI